MSVLAMPTLIYTVGYGTRSLDDFLALLRHYAIERLIDVRTVPRSRHNPQFNKETFGVFLRLRGINYRHLPELGGLRHARADSPNGGWRNASFRGFADYMQTPAFIAAVGKLLTLAIARRTAIMCAETVPWRCHRSLIGDALLVRGVAVTDIISLTRSQPHTLTPMARVAGLGITYPFAQEPAMQVSASLEEKNALQRTVGEVVAADYRTAGIFEEHGIDFCCGGNVSLAVICQEKGLDPAVLLREIAAVNRESVDRSQNYAAWELPFLADYIVNTHHAYLKEVDGQIVAYTGKIAQVHGAHHPEVIEIAAIFGKIARDMEIHLREEEEVFFPALKRAAAAAKAGAVAAVQDRATISASLATLIREHEAIGDAVHTIRHLAKAYEIPDDVCNTFALTYRKLKEFEDDLHKHVHLENNILFPKAALL